MRMRSAPVHSMPSPPLPVCAAPPPPDAQSAHGPKYAERRATVRSTYMLDVARIRASSPNPLDGFVFKFVSGYSPNATAEKELSDEAELYGDFVRIPFMVRLGGAREDEGG